METFEEDSSIEVLDSLETPVASLDDLSSQFLPTIAARIWEACCWPDRMTDGWKIGDYRFVVFSIDPEPKTELYIQLWSEPRETTLMEVCSGEWAPPAVKYVQDRQRGLLRELGFKKGGPARNFRKGIAIQNVTDAEKAGREILRIFYEAFRYRGQWPLRIRLEAEERCEQMPVFSSLTLEDVAKLLAEHGYTTIVPEVEDTALILLRRGRRRFTARLDGRVPRQDLYRAIILDAVLMPSEKVSDTLVTRLNDQIAGITVRKAANGELRLSMLMLLDGGVTQGWIVSSLEYWMASVRNSERSLQRLQKVTHRAKSRRLGQTQVH
jgi:hypothetical protein